MINRADLQPTAQAEAEPGMTYERAVTLLDESKAQADAPTSVPALDESGKRIIEESYWGHMGECAPNCSCSLAKYRREVATHKAERDAALAEVANLRAALDAVRAVERRDMQNGPDCKRCDEYERKCDCAEPDVEIMRAVYVLSRDLDAALALANPEVKECVAKDIPPACGIQAPPALANPGVL